MKALTTSPKDKFDKKSALMNLGWEQELFQSGGAVNQVVFVSNMVPDTDDRGIEAPPFERNYYLLARFVA